MPIAQAKIGIIYPPPEVRTIVDKTASFVARNGPEFQEKIRQNEINNPKFNFLNDNDPYHAYYKHKVKEFEENKGQDVQQQQLQQQQQQSQNQLPAIQKLSLTSKTQEQQTKIIEQMFIPKEPPPDFEYIIEAPSITPLDIDVIKLTAQFVARNGRPFLTGLMNKEQRNSLFDFLKPQHSHFSYFTRLVEHYTKILLPSKDLNEKFKKESSNVFTILKDVQYRCEWQKYQMREKAREDELIEKERVAYAQIDWHDFVVVETVDYQPNEMGNFPPPTTPADVGARVVAQERLETLGSNANIDTATLIERIIEDESVSTIDYATRAFMNEISLAPPVDMQTRVVDKNIDEVAMDEDSDEESNNVTSEKVQEKMNQFNKKQQNLATMQPPLPLPMPRADLPLPPKHDKVIIRKDYDPKSKTTASTAASNEEYFTSPLTGERIPASSIAEHMRISLLDPKWLETKEKEKKEREEQEEVLAPGISIEQQLKAMAERRSDIFGSGADETIIGKKIGEEDRRKEEKATWDGHTATMEKTTKLAMSGITIGDQIKQIHQTQGLVEDENLVNALKIGPSVVPVPKQMTTLNAPATNTQTMIMPNYAYKLQNINVRPVDSTSILLRAPGVPVGQTPVMLQPTIIRTTQPTILMPTVQAYIPSAPVEAPSQPSTSSVIPTTDLVEEPPLKRFKTEDQLMSEEEFLSRSGGSTSLVSFNLQIPNIPDKGEWNLNGQTISFTLQLGDQVNVIKTKLSEILGMPPGKQKLQFEGMFIKDSNTLAYYNLTNDSTIQLQLKERGGRKK